MERYDWREGDLPESRSVVSDLSTPYPYGIMEYEYLLAHETVLGWLAMFTRINGTYIHYVGSARFSKDKPSTISERGVEMRGNWTEYLLWYLRIGKNITNERSIIDMLQFKGFNESI